MKTTIKKLKVTDYQIDENNNLIEIKLIPSNEEIICKINEIIDCINKKEK